MKVFFYLIGSPLIGWVLSFDREYIDDEPFIVVPVAEIRQRSSTKDLWQSPLKAAPNFGFGFSHF